MSAIKTSESRWGSVVVCVVVCVVLLRTCVSVKSSKTVEVMKVAKAVKNWEGTTKGKERRGEHECENRLYVAVCMWLTCDTDVFITTV